MYRLLQHTANRADIRADIAGDEGVGRAAVGIEGAIELVFGEVEDREDGGVDRLARRNSEVEDSGGLFWL